MNLLRPIKMSLATRPPSIYDLVCAPGSALDATGAGTGSGLFVYDDNDVLTSFYLPRGTTKILHIHRYSSDTRIHEYVQYFHGIVRLVFVSRVFFSNYCYIVHVQRVRY